MILRYRDAGPEQTPAADRCRVRPADRDAAQIANAIRRTRARRVSTMMSTHATLLDKACADGIAGSGLATSSTRTPPKTRTSAT